MKTFAIGDKVRWGVRNRGSKNRRNYGVQSAAFHFYDGVVVRVEHSPKYKMDVPVVVYQGAVWDDEQEKHVYGDITVSFRPHKSGEWMLDTETNPDPKGRHWAFKI